MEGALKIFKLVNTRHRGQNTILFFALRVCFVKVPALFVRNKPETIFHIIGETHGCNTNRVNLLYIIAMKTIYLIEFKVYFRKYPNEFKSLPDCLAQYHFNNTFKWFLKTFPIFQINKCFTFPVNLKKLYKSMLRVDGCLNKKKRFLK